MARGIGLLRVLTPLSNGDSNAVLSAHTQRGTNAIPSLRNKVQFAH